MLKPVHRLVSSCRTSALSSGVEHPQHGRTMKPRDEHGERGRDELRPRDRLRLRRYSSDHEVEEGDDEQA